MKRTIGRIAGLLLAAAAGAAVSQGWAALQSASEPPRIGPLIEASFPGTDRPESARMLLAIRNGEPLNSRMGWYGPGKAARSWDWLAERHGVEWTGAIAAEKFAGRPEWFRALDWDKDGSVTREDLDWSNDREAADADSSPELARAWEAGAARAMGVGPPTTEQIVRAFFAGDLGSMNEGPPVGGRAPDFTLPSDDGSGPVRLYDLVGEKPVVLVFGSLTCNRFRDRFERVDDLAKRFRDDATFLMVYVREAHPDDGWVVAENAVAGVSAPRATTPGGRAGAASQCRALLRPSMPMVLDTAGDPTAEEYSAPPVRIYVIDRDGTVAYKSGRGPFGFKPVEAEQALILTLLAAEQPGKAEDGPADAGGG